GGGLDDAGYAGLAWLEKVGVPAATVAHTSARIADAADELAHGVISHVNALAAALRVRAGLRCDLATKLLRSAPRVSVSASLAPPNAEARVVLLAATERCAEIRVLDSIGLACADDDGAVLVIGSHGSLHGGRPE